MLAKSMLKMYANLMIDADKLAAGSRDTDSLDESEFRTQYTSLCLLLADAETDAGTDDGAYWTIVYENQITWLCEQNPKAADNLSVDLAALRDKDIRHNTHLAAEALLRGMSNTGNF